MKESLKKLFKIIPDKIYIIYISIILSIITSFAALKGPYILGDMTNILVAGISINKNKVSFNIDYDKLKYYLFLTLLLYSIVMVFSIFQAILMSKINVIITYKLREKVNNKINKLSISYLDKRKDGDIISIIVNDISTLSNSFNNILSSIIPAIITIIGTIILMLTISITLTFIVIIFVPLIIFTMMTVIKLSQKYFNILQDKLAILNSHIEEMFSNHDIVIAFNGQEESINKFNDTNNDLFKVSFLSQFLSGLPIPIVTVLNNINYSFVALAGSILMFKNIINIGMMQTFIQYLNGFHRPLSQLSQMSSNLQQIKATSNRIFDFLELEEMEDESNFEKINLDNFNGNISFENVNFSYNKDKKIIDNLNFEIKSGEKIAIVGHTGSGKTTIINLLMKFYDIDSGDIKIDGISIKNISKKDISKLFTMVLQDTWLFEGSIKENIEFGTNKEVSFQNIKEAAKNANSEHFINTLPLGYNTLLNEETNNLSQGEKQLLSITRAFLKDSKILILDEATSSIDSRTEKIVQQSMINLMKNKTSFIIAHRLSTIKEADKIILLDKGKIVEMGSHDELMNLNGEYKKLYNIS